MESRQVIWSDNLKRTRLGRWQKVQCQFRGTITLQPAQLLASNDDRDYNPDHAYVGDNCSYHRTHDL